MMAGGDDETARVPACAGLRGGGWRRRWPGAWGTRPGGELPPHLPPCFPSRLAPLPPAVFPLDWPPLPPLIVPGHRREIRMHISEPFWTIDVKLPSMQGLPPCTFAWDRGRLFDEHAAMLLHELCRDHPQAVVLEARRGKGCWLGMLAGGVDVWGASVAVAQGKARCGSCPCRAPAPVTSLVAHPPPRSEGSKSQSGRRLH